VRVLLYLVKTVGLPSLSSFQLELVSRNAQDFVDALSFLRIASEEEETGSGAVHTALPTSVDSCFCS
jgi:hypothetical protein